jgi:site-specific DNA-cytosine methylase
MRILSLFDGLACGRLALHQLGIEVTRYVASEIAPAPMAIANHNFPTIEQVGDVTKYFPQEGEFDVIICGSPCQGFSLAGKQLNFDDPRSKLFFEFIRILKTVKPKYFFLENNRMKKEYEQIITDAVGVAPLRINSALVSAQNRNRLYWTNIPNATVPEDRKIPLSSIVGAYDGIYVVPRGFNEGGVQPYKGKSPTVTCSSWHHNFFKWQNGQKVKFTINEVEAIQTLPVDYTNAPNVSLTNRYKACGNTWTLEVIKHLFSGLK